MKKLVLLSVFVIGLLVFVGCGNEVVLDANEQEMSQENFESTLEQIFKKGGKMTCAISTISEGVNMEGMLYIDGEIMKTEITTNIMGKEMMMYTLVKDGNSYIWSDNDAEGMMFPYDEDEEEDEEEYEEGELEEEDGEETMSFACKKGITDKSTFLLPKDITFKNMAEFDMFGY